MNNKIDWVRKLTSRKFWLAIAGLVAGIIIACNGGEDIAQKVTGIIMSAGSIVSYVFSEGIADAASVKAKKEEDNENDQA